MNIVVADQIMFSHRHNLLEELPPNDTVTQRLRVWFSRPSCFRVEVFSSPDNFFVYASFGDEYFMGANGQLMKDPNGNSMIQSENNLPPFIRSVSCPHLLHAGFALESSDRSDWWGEKVTISRYSVVPNAGIGADLVGPRLTIAQTDSNQVVFWIEELECGGVNIGQTLSQRNQDVDSSFPWLSSSPIG